MTVDGERDILGLWEGTGGEGAKYWLAVLTELKNRGVEDVCIVVCDGLKGLPDAITATWPQALTQTCVIHLLRNSFRYASRRDWPTLARDLKPVYTAPTEGAALERLVRRDLGGPLSGDRQTVGVGVGRVRALLELRSRDPDHLVYDECG